MKSICFVGNSCTGKTTSAFAVVRNLKLKRALTSYSNDVCRFVSFPPAKFDIDPNARLHVLFRQLAAETENMVRDDADYLVMERTVLDWFLYYEWTCKQAKVVPDPTVEALCWGWAMTNYDLIFYMDSHSMVYVNDGFRPHSTRIRDEINASYSRLYYDLLDRTPKRVVLIEGDDLGERNALVEQHLDGWLEKNLVVRR